MEHNAIADSIGDSMMEMQRLRARMLAQVSAAMNDTFDPPAFHCLKHLTSDGPMQSKALAAAVCSDPSTVSRQIATLVDKGLVRREADPHDGRATVLAATEQGHEAVREARRRRNASLDMVLADWAPEERAQFADLLARFVAGYRTHRDEIVASWCTEVNGEKA